ncbi:hypothetical protein Q1695_005169 [Nippostrongylus brasiliensis]|nr:hypothetical protein Q1695_005169 [Nippostrongylus brasiliensis]
MWIQWMGSFCGGNYTAPRKYKRLEERNHESRKEPGRKGDFPRYDAQCGDGGGRRCRDHCAKRATGAAPCERRVTSVAPRGPPPQPTAQGPLPYQSSG